MAPMNANPKHFKHKAAKLVQIHRRKLQRLAADDPRRANHQRIIDAFTGVYQRLASKDELASGLP